MKLQEIIDLPADYVRKLAEYGVTTADQFYEHGVRFPSGVIDALGINEDILSALVGLIERYISDGLKDRVAQLTTKNKRGALCGIRK